MRPPPAPHPVVCAAAGASRRGNSSGACAGSASKTLHLWAAAAHHALCVLLLSSTQGLDTRTRTTAADLAVGVHACPLGSPATFGLHAAPPRRTCLPACSLCTIQPGLQHSCVLRQGQPPAASGGIALAASESVCLLALHTCCCFTAVARRQRHVPLCCRLPAAGTRPSLAAPLFSLCCQAATLRCRAMRALPCAGPNLSAAAGAGRHRAAAPDRL